MSSSSLLRLAGHLTLLQQAELYPLIAEEDVGSDSQVSAEHDLLVNSVDSVVDRLLRLTESHWLAVPQDRRRPTGGWRRSKA